MFAHMVKAAGSARNLPQSYHFNRSARAEIESRLKPLEKIVRILLMIEAATFLLMTPEGAVMHREAKLAAPPASSCPAGTPPPPCSRALIRASSNAKRLSKRNARRETLARAKVEAAIVVDLPGPEGLTKNRARRARPGHSALLLQGHPLEAD